MKIHTSIRSYMRGEVGNIDYINRKGYIVGLVQRQAQSALPKAARSPFPAYKLMTGLWGRISVALSGAAARRERACGRLNTFSATDEGYKSPDQVKWRKAAKGIAVEKFQAIYNASNAKQRDEMYAKLTASARDELEDAEYPGTFVY
ncbi:hypothetical protein [Duganella qianjiadongensis]|uniref:Uncharacterized protein n=1 Tax=Duganella qianjiadongensis TaxID=2692176 RepID=A0ABW9VJ34_9BURK|nr:hypothetical protein [Duganella qianjiadongensis]MYM39468.1 hypothetical protein [Duganella qianjiadongensis]